MEWDFVAGFGRSDPPHRFGKNGWREEIKVRGDELGVRIHPVRNNAPLAPSGPEALWAGGCSGVRF